MTNDNDGNFVDLRNNSWKPLFLSSVNIGAILFRKGFIPKENNVTLLTRDTNYGFNMNYFDDSSKHLPYFFNCKSVMEMHVITKSTNGHDHSCFSYIDN